VSLRRLFGEGKFAVIAGRRLNDEPLTRAEADRLAKSSPAKAPRAGVEVSPPPPKRKPAAASAPRPAPAVDLRAEPWLSAGGSAGFTIRGCG
jgi:hypothetical protein